MIESGPEPLSCVARCVVDGERINKQFVLAVRRDEDDTDTLRRALARARELVAFETGWTKRSVRVELVQFR